MDRSYHRPAEGTYQAALTGLAERRQGATTFITGGVTRDEADALRAAMPRYILSLEFARANTPRGDFPANVDVSITDTRGQPMLRTVAEGPFVLANLRPGQYTVRAASEGQVRTQTVTVAPGEHRHLTFTW